MNRSLFQTISERLLAARHILVVTHVAPDGDAIGSLLGLGWLLHGQGRQSTLACQDPVPDNYRFLPGSDRVVHHAAEDHDLIVTLDCSDRQRMGERLGALAGRPLINVDHHVTNTLFGSINWVDPACVSTTQMLLTLAEALSWKIAPPAADCLLCGLVTDTRSFRTSNVDLETIKAAMRLMSAGASLPQVARRALDERALAVVRLWGQAIAGVQLQDGVLWTWITRAMRHALDLKDNDASGFTNFLSGVREAKIVVVFYELDDGTVDVGMRAVPGLDVAQVAFRLGGGGHPQAAGCTLQGDPQAVEQRLLAELHTSLAAQEAGRG